MKVAAFGDDVVIITRPNSEARKTNMNSKISSKGTELSINIYKRKVRKDLPDPEKKLIIEEDCTETSGVLPAWEQQCLKIGMKRQREGHTSSQ